MIVQPSLPTLIKSAIGALSMKRIADAENHTVPDDKGDVKKSLLELQARINSAHFNKRTSPEVIEKIVAILKSVEVTCAPEFLVFIGRKYPSMMMEISRDEVVRNRIRHIYRVAEISSCFSIESMKKLNKGIEDARKRVFEIDQRQEEE